MLGHIANFFLDELIHDHTSTFDNLFAKVFQLNPIAFSLFSDEQVKDVHTQAANHYKNLRRQIEDGFPNQKIEVEDCFIEPSFYSEKYGIQGRLDILHKPTGNEIPSIIELKSGSPYGKNRYGLSASHYTQTLLYDLLIKSVFGKETDPRKYILYSKLDENNLKFAPSVKAKQMEALKVRNEIMILEKRLLELDSKREGEPSILDHLKPSNFPHLRGFHKRDLQVFSDALKSISPIVRKYFLAFTSFVAREHHLAKTGEEGIEHMNGMANLWLSPFQLKQENFDIISHLVIESNNSTETEPIIVFNKTDKTNQLANFREGDIAVLYPSYNPTITILDNQIFKCSIIHLDSQTVHVRLRSRQSNDKIFQENPIWNLEHDLMDSSFNQLYRNLFEFLSIETGSQQLLLGQKPPGQNTAPIPAVPEHLNHEQQRIIKKILQSQDYFLLMGPPGTGKTKFMLKELVRWLVTNTDESVLLLAYTNRAVDEICEALAGVSDNYIRIGSRYSTSKPYREKLLQNLIKDIGRRSELRNLLKGTRLVVGTVSSFMGKSELLQLKDFDSLIIDEASQLLEPFLISLLPKVGRFFLIGDHKQLPAVVRQPKERSIVDDEELDNIGLVNRRNSLFERLYRVAVAKKWNWSFDMLTCQGRMHEEIAEFPDKQFYAGDLSVLESPDGKSWQKMPLDLKNPMTSGITDLLVQHRFAFIASQSDTTSISNKTNLHEAGLVVKVVKELRNIYAFNEMPLSDDSIGVITPYRAQISQINKAFEETDTNLSGITIDTVERYQGGARDIIILSLCINSPTQMETLVSLTDDGKVDRKLNVALTRARKHLIVIGNTELISTSAVYRRMIDFLAEKRAILEHKEVYNPV